MYTEHEMEVVQYEENVYVVASGDGTIEYFDEPGESDW